MRLLHRHPSALLLLAALQLACLPQHADPAPEASSIVEDDFKDYAELLEVDPTCPADARTKTEEFGYQPDLCNGKITECLQACQDGDGPACYSLAVLLQDEPFSSTVPVSYTEALFHHACRLGIVTGCTNRAAGLLRFGEASDLECASRTFKAGCEAEDPWACAMFGRNLSEGLGVEQDIDEALSILAKTCQIDPEDPACSAAQGLAAEIMDSSSG